jgi:mannose-6-phosphate isomerase-like protein (cupin superfamily)
LGAVIKSCDRDSEYYFEEGCFITELLNDDRDPQVSIARARVAPGETTRWHRLQGTSERYVILEGRGEVEVDGLPRTAVGNGDVVLIPAGAAQRISNTGDSDLLFLAICAPRFKPEVYEDLEE